MREAGILAETKEMNLKEKQKKQLMKGIEPRHNPNLNAMKKNKETEQLETENHED